MTELINWKTSDDRRDVVHRAVQSLVEGQLVAFPTETVYGVAAYPLNEQAMRHLVEAKQRDPQKPVALAFGSADKVREYFPNLGRVASRLVSRCFPGPVTLVLPVPENSPLSELPASVQEAAVPATGVGVRVPSHEAILETLRLLPYPLVLTSANISGEQPAVDAATVMERLGDQLSMVIDDGPSPGGQPSTVLRVEDDTLQVLREGAVPVHRLKRLAGEVILFVCTGNSCRSPMAEAIFKRMLADAIHCEVDELPERGYTVISAGISAMGGGPAASGAIQAVRAFNAALDDHVSQGLSPDLLRYSDRILVMTRDHREALRVMAPSLWSIAEPKTVLLGGDRDIDDPIGGSDEQYNRCAQQISAYLRPLLAQVLQAGQLTVRT